MKKIYHSLISIMVIMVFLCQAAIFDCALAQAASQLRPLAAGEKNQLSSIERVLKAELTENPWILISRPRRNDQCPRFVYRCGGRIIHVPTTLKSQSSADVAIQNVGSRLAPTTMLRGITLPSEVIKDIKPRLSGRLPGRTRRDPAAEWQPPRIIYVQDFVNPLAGLDEDAMKKGERWVEGGLLAEISEHGDAGIARAKRIIDDYFNAVEEMWEAGIFNLDATLINAGADTNDMVRFFDLGGFTDVSTVEAARALAETYIPEILKIDEEEDIQEAVWPIQRYFISQAKLKLTVDNMIQHWKSGFSDGFKTRRKADEVAISASPTPPMKAGAVSQRVISQLEASI